MLRHYIAIILLGLAITPAKAGQGLPPCPSSPNCVLSSPTAHTAALRPWQLRVNTPQSWTQVIETTLQIPRSTLIHEGSDGLHVEVRSAMLGFVDDLELSLDRDSGSIVVRSASRSGYYDFGVNRRRVTQLYLALTNQHIIQSNNLHDQ